MTTLPGLDIDLLRTLALIAEEGSFTRAAERVGRTQSAVSLQMQRLEAVVGHSLLLRGKGGGVELSAQGKYLVERSRELLALNDEILGSLRAPPIHGTVRLGSSDENLQRYLPRILARFADTHPAVAVDILCGASCQLVPQLKMGNMDLMLCESGHEPRQWPAVELWRGPLKWITSDQYAPHLKDPLPLSLSIGNCPWRPAWLDECVWRGAALRSLERAGRRYQIVSTSATVSAQQAAVIAGRAVTVSTIIGLPPELRPVRTGEGLPDLPDTSILLLKAREARQPMTDALAAYIAEAFHDEVRLLGGC